MPPKCTMRDSGMAESRYPEEGLLLRGVVGLDSLGLDDDRGITVLVVLTLRGDGAGYVTGHHREGKDAQG